jgi:DNA-binding NtrC family response regulator
MFEKIFPSTKSVAAERPVVSVLESNPKVLNYLRRTFSDQYALTLCEQAEPFLTALATDNSVDIIVFAWDGREVSLPVLTRLREIKPTTPVIVLTCSIDTHDFEIFATLGATSVVLKPFVDDNLEIAIAKSLPTNVVDADPKEVQLNDSHSFIRSSKRMCEIESQAMLVAKSDIPVLILGESGTGKEILALFTHKMSRRSKEMFLKINCAAMPAELLESELFGYEQGAFTGAVKTKPGKFEVCDGGTIFLDEIGEMPALLQAKLLQVLQDGTFSRLGSRTSMRCDVRIIAATNIDMKQSIAEKSFRADLYYRLNGLSLNLPPLRERLDEIPTFVKYFLRKGAKRYDLPATPVSASFIHALQQYNWPGNLRELENVINRFLVLQDERAVLADLPASTTPVVQLAAAAQPEDTQNLKELVRGVKGEAEAAVIATVLEKKGWNRKAAASDLQISYKALLYKIKQYEIAPRSV